MSCPSGFLRRGDSRLWRRRSIFGRLACDCSLVPLLLPTALAPPPRSSPWPQNLFFGWPFSAALLSALEWTPEWSSGRMASSVSDTSGSVGQRSWRLGQFDAEDIRHFRFGHGGRAIGARRLADGFGGGGFADKIGGIHAAEQKKQFGVLIQPRADAIQRGGDMLAEIGPIRAGAVQFDFFGRREKPSFGAGDDLHDRRGKFALEQFDEGIDFPGAFGLDGFPEARRQRLDFDFDFVKARSRHAGGHLALADLEINHRTVADISAAARQAVGIVAVSLQVVAPCLAPEGAGDLAAFQQDRRGGLAILFGQLGHFTRGLGAAFRHRHIRPPSKAPTHIFSPIKRVMVHSPRSLIFGGGLYIQRHKTKQFGIVHFRQQSFRAFAQYVLSQRALGGDDVVDAFLQRAAADEFVDHHIALLTDAECAIRGLVFDGGIPPAVEMNDMGGGGEIEAGAAGFEREDKKGRAAVPLKGLHQFPAPAPPAFRREAPRRLGQIPIPNTAPTGP